LSLWLVLLIFCCLSYLQVLIDLLDDEEIAVRISAGEALTLLFNMNENEVRSLPHFLYMPTSLKTYIWQEKQKYYVTNQHAYTIASKMLYWSKERDPSAPKKANRVQRESFLAFLTELLAYDPFSSLLSSNDEFFGTFFIAPHFPLYFCSLSKGQLQVSIKHVQKKRPNVISLPCFLCLSSRYHLKASM
jgi:hypothetical protein